MNALEVQPNEADIDSGATLHILYRFFDAAGDLLYVGITCNPPGRLKGHKTTKSWWSEVANITMERAESRSELKRLETAAIRRENPRYNIALKPQPRPVQLSIVPTSSGVLSVSQATARTGIPKRTLQNAIATGRLKAHKLAGATAAYLIDEADLDRWTAHRDGR